MKKWDGRKNKNDRLRAGDEVVFFQEERLLRVYRGPNSPHFSAFSNVVRWQDGDDAQLVVFIPTGMRGKCVFSELVRLLASAAGLARGKTEEVRERGQFIAWKIVLEVDRPQRKHCAVAKRLRAGLIPKENA